MADVNRKTVRTLVLHHAVCALDGCERNTSSKTSNICSMHKGRYERTGSYIGRNRGRVAHELYNIYKLIKRRCYSSSCSRYKDYGGRGIKVCDRWLGDDGFENFVADMGDRPSKTHSIDRIDVNEGYSPSNCRWATKFEQAQNTRVKSNTSIVGVSLGRWGYRAYITKDRKQKHLGWFDNLSDAINARKREEVNYV